MSAANDVQRAVFDSLSEKQIDQCRAILIYHLGGRQEKWPLDRHDKAGGYDLPLTASERELTHLTKNHVVALILRICGVEETTHETKSSLAELRARCEAAERDAERYRWIRENKFFRFIGEYGGHKSMDEIIDAALAAQHAAQRKEEGK